MDRYRPIPRSRIALAGALAGATAFAVSTAPAPAQQPAAVQTISVIGKAEVKPTPVDRKSNASISKAVADARAAATPRAIAAGRRRAAALAAATGLPLGALISIAEAPPSPFGFPGPYGEDGTFGPGKYCGLVRSVTVRRDAQGRRRPVRSKRHRICRVPSEVAANLTMVFASG
jgi:uncharacterized protein YggE